MLIPVPFGFCVGTILGVTGLNPYEFLRIVTEVSPTLYSMSRSVTNLSVLPSNTRSLGATLYPLPKEVIPMDSKEDRASN